MGHERKLGILSGPMGDIAQGRRCAKRESRLPEPKLNSNFSLLTIRRDPFLSEDVRALSGRLPHLR